MIDVTFLPAANQDFHEAYNWYHTASPRAAAGFEAAVEVALSSLAASPLRWPSYDERHRFYVLRRYPFKLVYRVIDDRVLIVAVAHLKRSPKYWKDRI